MAKMEWYGWAIICLFSFFLISLTSALPINNSLHINIQATDGAGNIVTGTFPFQWNITTASDCTGVLYSNTATLTTDSRGIISYYLDSANLDWSQQYYLCTYRSGTLTNKTLITRVPSAFHSSFSNWSNFVNLSNIPYNYNQSFNFSQPYYNFTNPGVIINVVDNASILEGSPSSGGYSITNLYPYSKGGIFWRGWDEATNKNTIVGWIVCHYNSTGNTDIHSHCSWETLDNSTGTPSINSHFEISYNGSQTLTRVAFPSAYIDSPRINSIYSQPGGTVTIKPDSTFTVYPNNQTTIGFSISNDSNNITITGFGTNNIEFLDNGYFNGKNVTANNFFGSTATFTGQVTGNSFKGNQLIDSGGTSIIDARNPTILIGNGANFNSEALYGNVSINSILNYGYRLYVNGSARIDGNLIINGTVNATNFIGNGSLLTGIPGMTYTNLALTNTSNTFNGSILFAQNGTWDVGSINNRVNNLYLYNFYTNTLQTGSTYGQLTIAGGWINNYNEGARIRMSGNVQVEGGGYSPSNMQFDAISPGSVYNWMNFTISNIYLYMPTIVNNTLLVTNSISATGKISNPSFSAQTDGKIYQGDWLGDNNGAWGAQYAGWNAHQSGDHVVFDMMCEASGGSSVAGLCYFMLKNRNGTGQTFMFGLNGGDEPFINTGSSDHLKIEGNGGVPTSIKALSYCDSLDTCGIDYYWDKSVDQSLTISGGVIVAYSTNFDSVLMKNVTSISSASKQVLNLTQISFNWNENASFNNKTNYGYSAQDIQKYLPSCYIPNRTTINQYRTTISWKTIDIKEAFETVEVNLTETKNISTWKYDMDKQIVYKEDMPKLVISDKTQKITKLKQDVIFNETDGTFLQKITNKQLIEKAGNYTTYDSKCVDTFFQAYFTQIINKICSRSPTLCQ